MINPIQVIPIKPPTEAVRVTYEMLDEMYELEAWCHGEVKGTGLSPHHRVIKIQTVFGEQTAKLNDWIVTDGENFLVLGDDDFKNQFRMKGQDNETLS